MAQIIYINSSNIEILNNYNENSNSTQIITDNTKNKMDVATNTPDMSFVTNDNIVNDSNTNNNDSIVTNITNVSDSNIPNVNDVETNVTDGDNISLNVNINDNATYTKYQSSDISLQTEYEQTDSELDSILSTELSSISSTESLNEFSDRIHIINIYNIINSIIDFDFYKINTADKNKYLLKNLSRIEKEIKTLKKICKFNELCNPNNLKKSVISFFKKTTKPSAKGRIKQDDIFVLYCRKNNINISKDEFNNIVKQRFKLSSMSKDNILYWTGIKMK